MYITKKIKDLIRKKPILFTTPGHSGGKYISSAFKDIVGEKVFNADFSEVQGMDNLHCPNGIIKQSMEWANEIYSSKNTFYLVNGSTSGIIALMYSVAKRGEKVLITRNAHKSVINALVLTGVSPVWVNPELDNDWGIPSCLCPFRIKQKLEENPNIKAVFATTPTYEGIVCDVEAIAKICREKNIPLIIDEAHGALWNFSDKLPVSSIHLGADACVQSVHKTGACLNQGAVLHLSKTTEILPETVQRNLNFINTTSPSYLLLSSIESSIEYLNSPKGRTTLNKLVDNIEEIKFYLTLKLDIEFLESGEFYTHDPTKIFFRLKGIPGNVLADILQEKFNLEIELDNNIGVLALAGIGTTKTKLKKLADSLIKAEKFIKKSGIYAEENNYVQKNYCLIEPEVICTPEEAFNRASRKINIYNAVGLVSKETIVSYPPGIPVIVTGETIKEEHIEFLKHREEIEVILD